MREVGQAKANLAVARLPARPEEIKAAENQVKQAAGSARPGAMAARQARHCRRRRPAASTTSSATPGDVAGPSAPVISMLPDGAVKLKVYVPEAGVLVGADRLDAQACVATAARPD